MRHVFLRKVGDLSTPDGYAVNAVPAASGEAREIATQKDDSNMPPLHLERQAPGLHELSFSDADGQSIQLSYASIRTPFGIVGAIGVDAEEATSQLVSALTLANSGGSGAEMATGEPHVSSAAASRIHAFVNHQAEHRM